LPAPENNPAPFLCIGHRGARGHEPENTLRSVRRALELGVDGIEVDVHLCEGRLVVIHDRRVDRTTNGRGRVSRKRFDALRALDAGRGEQIPTLEEVIEVINRRVFLNVELKGRGTAGPVREVIERAVREAGWSYGDFLVSSFHRQELRALAGGPIPLGILFSRRPRDFARLAAELGATALNTPLRYTTVKFIEAAHALGLRVFVYTVNAPADIHRIRTAGADGIFTDFPDRV
jgi:glycerophosphoryl diester phosphodiesterase